MPMRRMPELTQFDKREIDDAEFAAERHRGLRAPVGQRPEPRAAPAGEHQRERLRASCAIVGASGMYCLYAR